MTAIFEFLDLPPDPRVLAAVGASVYAAPERPSARYPELAHHGVEIEALIGSSRVLRRYAAGV